MLDQNGKTVPGTHQLIRHTVALVLAGGRGSRLKQLTDSRAKPAVYFGGKFRIVDFALSNCLNSGIRRMAVVTQYKSHSLMRHLQRGWSFLRAELNEMVDLLPAQQRVGEGHWYRGTADAIYQNLDIIRSSKPDYIVILAGDHVYKMDYGQMLADHVGFDADMTIACIEVPLDEAAGAYGVIEIDSDWRIIGFEEKPEHPKPIPGQPDLCLASMGNYLFNTGFLYEQLIKDADDPQSSRDFGRDIIPSVYPRYRVKAHPFRDMATGERAYWRDVGTVYSFWKANLELVAVTPELNMYDDNWPILTYQAQQPPAKFVFNDPGRRGEAVDSMVSGGCIISGASVRRSLLFSNVEVHEHSMIRDSVVLPDVNIAPDCNIQNAVIDRGSNIPRGSTIGFSEDEDRAAGFHRTAEGIVLVTPDMLGQRIHMVR